MSDVSCQVFEFFERACPAYGIAYVQILEGTALTLETLQNPRNRVSWDDWALLCNNFERLVGPEENRRFSRNISEHGYNSPFARLAGAIIEPARAYDAGLKWVGATLFRNLRFEVEVLSSDRARAVITIPETHRGSAAWLRMAQGSMEGLTQTLGLEPAAVRSLITPHRGEYDIVCPPSRTLLARARRRIGALTSSTSIVAEFDILQRELRQAYEETRAAEAELRAVVDALPAPVAILIEDRIAHHNHEWSALLGCDAQAFSDLVLSGSPDPEQVSECTLRRRDGGTCAVEVRPRVGLRWEDQPASLLVVRDRTEERREAERRVVQNRLASLGTLASVVGHEMNNPLGYAMGILELAELEVGRVDDQQIRQRIQEAASGLAKVARIARDLQTFALHPGETSAVRMDEVVQGALRIAGNQIRHTAVLQTDLAPIPPFTGDPGRLSQLVLNLVVNALHAVHATPSARLVVRTRRGAGDVTLEVEDNGPGVLPEHRERIFEPFFTTAPEEHSGLGLAVCRTLVEELGGTLSLVHSEPGRTVFRARFPVTLVAPPPQSTAPEDRSLHLLVVEDDPDLAELSTDLLAPFTVRVCTDPREALRVAGDEPFDAIVCDVMMPYLSGPELVDAIGESHPELAARVLFVTGGTFGDADLGARPVLRKPFSRKQLRRAVLEIATAS